MLKKNKQKSLSFSGPFLRSVQKPRAFRARQFGHLSSLPFRTSRPAKMRGSCQLYLTVPAGAKPKPKGSQLYFLPCPTRNQRTFGMEPQTLVSACWGEKCKPAKTNLFFWPSFLLPSGLLTPKDHFLATPAWNGLVYSLIPYSDLNDCLRAAPLSW